MNGINLKKMDRDFERNTRWIKRGIVFTTIFVIAMWFGVVYLVASGWSTYKMSERVGYAIERLLPLPEKKP